jgi:hypothetical protein
MIGFISIFFVESLVITINFKPNSSSLTAENSLHSRSHSLSLLIVYHLYSLEADP